MLWKQKISIKKTILLAICNYIIQGIMTGFIIFSIITPIYKTISAVDGNLVTTSPTLAPDPTANWQIYQGNGFEFNYPNDWSQDTSITKVQGENKQLIIFGPKKTINHIGEKVEPYTAPLITLSIEDIDRNITMEDYMNYSDSLKPKWTDYKVKNLNTKQVKHLGCTSGNCRDIVFTAKDKIYIFSEQNDVKELDQILSTFKFTNSQVSPTPDVTANWKAYASDFGNFQVKYPPELLYDLIPQSYEPNYSNVGFYEQQPPGLWIIPIHFLTYQKADSYVNMPPNWNDLENLLNLQPNKTLTLGGLIYSKSNDSTIIDGVVAQKYRAAAVPNYPAEIHPYRKGVIFKKNGKFYDFYVDSSTTEDKFTKYFDQMLPTIKFTN